MSEPTPSEMNAVVHIKRTSTGRTTMQISLSIELRCMIALAAKRHNMSQLSLIRCALTRYMQWLDSPPEGPTQCRRTGPGTGSVPQSCGPSPGGRPRSLVPEPVPEPEPSSLEYVVTEPSSLEPASGSISPTLVEPTILELVMAAPSSSEDVMIKPTMMPDTTPSRKRASKRS